MRYLTVKKFSSESGYTESAIRKKIAAGTWPEERVWRRAPDNRILIDVEGFVSWVETPQAPHLKGLSLPSAQHSLRPASLDSGQFDETPVHEELVDKVFEKRLAELIGTTQKALEHKRRSGMIPREVWQKIGGRIFYSRTRYDEWIESLWSAPTKGIIEAPRQRVATKVPRTFYKGPRTIYKLV